MFFVDGSACAAVIITIISHHIWVRSVYSVFRIYCGQALINMLGGRRWSYRWWNPTGFGEGIYWSEALDSTDGAIFVPMQGIMEGFCTNPPWKRWWKVVAVSCVRVYFKFLMSNLESDLDDPSLLEQDFLCQWWWPSLPDEFYQGSHPTKTTQKTCWMKALQVKVLIGTEWPKFNTHIRFLYFWRQYVSQHSLIIA